MQEGRSVYLENLTADPVARQSEIVLSLGIKAIAGTPLMYEGRAIGAITVASTAAKSISDDDRSLIGYMANFVTAAVVKTQLYEAEKESRIKLGALENIAEAGLTVLSINDLLNEIANRIVQDIRMDWTGIILFESKNGRSVIEHTSDGCSSVRGKSLSQACSVMNDIMATGKTKILKRNELNEVRQHFSDSRVRVIAMVPVALRQDWACMIGFGKKTGKSFSEKELELIESISFRSALAIENTLLFSKLEETYLETVESLVKAIEAKDKYTRGHSESVAAMSRDIAIEMELDEETVERVYVAGLLHDIGKIGIPSSILLKPSKLTSEDYSVIKLHPIKGYQIVKPVRSLGELAEIILQHHERYDGYGYPHGVPGKEILLEARILAVADAYQAMVSDRPYRKRLPAEEAVLEIEKAIGSQFDPDVANAFFSVLKRSIGNSDSNSDVKKQTKTKAKHSKKTEKVLSQK